MIAGLLLAAGLGRRFGADKLLAPLRGRPLLHWSASALAGAVDAVYVVVPHDAVPREEALHGVRVVVVPHAGCEAGMGSSIAAGIAALPPTAEAVVIALADQPLVDTKVVRRLCERWRDGGVTAVAPSYRDGRGHPVLFDRALFGALGALSGDAGARAVLDGLGDALALVPVDAPMPRDVDRPSDLEGL